MNPFSFFSPYKTLIEVLVIGALILGIGYGIHKFLQHEQDIGYKKAQAEYDAKLLEATQAARDKEAALTKQIQEAQNALAQRDQTIRSLSASAAAASNSLRDTTASISGRLSSISADAVRQIARTYGDIFTECQTRRRDLAEEAERLNSEKRTLIESWPK